MLSESLSEKPPLHVSLSRFNYRLPRETTNGSVANLVQGAMKGQLALSVWGLSSQRVEQFGRSEALVSGLTHQLFFLNHVHEFDPN